MKRIIALSCLLVLLSANAHSRTVKSIAVTPLAPIPLLTTADFTNAVVEGSAGGQAVLKLTLGEKAAQRLREYTTRNVGRELPLLIDGKLVQAPLVRVPIECNAFQVEPIERALAQEVAQLINAHR